MPIFKRVGRSPARSQEFFEFGREEIADGGRVVLPLIGNTPLMIEVAKVQRKSARRSKPHNTPHAIEISRPTIRREPHHLVFVAVVGKPEILRQRFVENAEGVRKEDSVFDRDIGARTDAPGGTCEVAKTVDRDNRSLSERRYMEGGNQMRLVMFDGVPVAAKVLARKRGLQKFNGVTALAAIAKPSCNKTKRSRTRQDVGHFAQEVRASKLVYRDMIDVRQLELRCRETIAYGLAGKSGPMLDAPEALLLGCRDEFAVNDEGRRRVAMEGVETKDNQSRTLHV